MNLSRRQFTLLALAPPPRKPNIVFVLADDLGWAELGCYGNTFNETPHLDRLARDGVRFTQAYAAAPVCSPTRVSLMTGQHPKTVGITDFLRADDPVHLSPTKYRSVAKRLAEAGYHTGLIGKWHLMGDYATRRGDPAKHGFAEVICSESKYIGPGYYFPPYQHMPEIAPKQAGEYLTDRINDEAVGFIERSTAPFFLYVAHYTVHTRLAAKKDVEARFAAKPGASAKKNNPALAAMLWSLDEGIGKMRAALEKKGVLDNTLFVFCSDNGGEDRVTVNGALRAGKSTLYEGGIRIPFLAKFPRGHHAGRVSDVPIDTLDVMPEFLQQAGSPLTKELVGQPFSHALTDGKRFAARPHFWHYPLDAPHFLGGRSAGAIREGDWKLIHFYDDNTQELYNLRLDPGESRNVLRDHPAVAAKLRRKFEAWRQS